MLGSSIIEFILSIAFIFLVLSLVVSTLIELGHGIFKTRAKMLRAWILQLDRNIGPNVYDHPLIKGFARHDRTRPTYIDGGLFAKAFLEVVNRAGAKLVPPAVLGSRSVSLPSPPTAPLSPAEDLMRLRALAFTPVTPSSTSDLQRYLEALRQAPRAKMDMLLPPSKARPRTRRNRNAIANLLSAFVISDPTKVEQNVTAWFNAETDRLSGTFKRRTQGATFIVGLLLAYSMNADAVAIGTNLWQAANKGQALPLATAAVDYAAKHPGTAIQPKELQGLVQTLRDSKILPEPSKDADRPLGLPAFEASHFMDASHLPGWLITALAVTLGASFWFDLISRFVNLRQAGQKPSPNLGKPA